MASITVERITGFLIVAFKRGAKAAVGAAVGAAVVAAFTGAVTQAVEAVVATAISAAIAAGIVSAVSGSVTQLTTQLVQKSIEKCLDEAVKDVISSHGIKDISKPKAVIASDEVLNELANATFEAVNPHLWAFKDPSFLKIAKLIRALRAVQKGERPESEDVGDDDCVEEKRRYFDGRMVEEFVFFTVFGSNDCKEGDEVYSMSVQQKKLESLIQDPFGGKLVNLFLQELSESCVEPVHEIKNCFPLLSGDKAAQNEKSKVETKPMKVETKPIKVVTIEEGKLFPFGNRKVDNVTGSANDKRAKRWLKAYFSLGYGACKNSYIASADPNCDQIDAPPGNTVGRPILNLEMKAKDKCLPFFILDYDEPKPDETGKLLTTKDAVAMQFASTSFPIAVTGTAFGMLNEIIKSEGVAAENWAKREGHNIMFQSLIPFYGFFRAIKRLYSLKYDAINKFYSEAQSRIANYMNKWKSCLQAFEDAVASKMRNLIDQFDTNNLPRAQLKKDNY